MRRPTWLIAAVLMLGLWAWSQRADHRVLEAPTAPAPTSAETTARGLATATLDHNVALQPAKPAKRLRSNVPITRV